jgi:hypothetical protein
VKLTLHTPLVTLLLIVQLMPAGTLVITPLPRDAGDGVTVRMDGIVGVTAAMNVAATVLTLPRTIDALQVCPLQLPLNPVKDPLPDDVALSAITMPAANAAEQVPLVAPAVMAQLMPSGALVIVPLPLPPPVMVSVPGGSGMRYVRSTVR